MRFPRPFTVRRSSGKFILTVYAPSLAQAHALIAARLSDTAGVTDHAALTGGQR